MPSDAREFHLEIAGVPLSLVSRDPDLDRHLEYTYAGFVDSEDHDRYVFDVSVVVTDPPEDCVRSPELAQEGTRVQIVDGHTNELVLDRQTRHGTIRCTRWPLPESGRLPLPRVGAQLRSFISTEVIQHQGLMLHGAAVELDDRGVIFAGESGAGKTTISGLFPADNVLNDELVVVQVAETAPNVLATPFSGEADTPRIRRTVPLNAICFLKKAITTTATRIDQSSSFSRLLKCVSLPNGQLALERTAFELAHRLVETVPSYELSFSKEARAVRAAVLRMLQQDA